MNSASIDPENPRPRAVRLLVGGDIVPPPEITGTSDPGQWRAIWGDLPDVASDHDLVVGNLECPLTRSGTRILKVGPHLHGPSHGADWVKGGGFHAVSLANNHIGDCGAEGVRDTLVSCREAGLHCFGAGPDLHSAQSPWITEMSGRRFAFIGVAEAEFGVASHAAAGVAPLDAVELFNAISSVRNQVDSVVVYVHGGTEYCPYPYPSMVRLMRFAVDVGADAVLCSHAHVFCGYEIYKGKPILYGLGNLFFRASGFIVLDGWHEGVLASLLFDGSEVRVTPIPYVQNQSESGVRLLRDQAKSAALERLDALCDMLSDPAVNESHWRKWTKRASREHLSRLLCLTRGERYAMKKGIWPFWRANRERLLVLLNYARCQAHHEAVTAVLEIATGIRSD